MNLQENLYQNIDKMNQSDKRLLDFRSLAADIVSRTRTTFDLFLNVRG